MNALQLLDVNDVLARTGTGRTKHYEDIKVGLLPEPVRRGEKFARWPSDEIDAIVQARIAGFEDEDIRGLVRRQMAVRSSIRSGMKMQ